MSHICSHCHRPLTLDESVQTQSWSGREALSGGDTICDRCRLAINANQMVTRSQAASDDSLRLASFNNLPTVSGVDRHSLPDELSSGGRLGRFQLVEKIGQGGFGNVFRAFDPSLKREVAIKIPRFNRKDRSSIAPEVHEDYIREAQAAAQLRSPNIVQVFEVQTDGQSGLTYIVSEYVKGPSLRQWLQERSPGLEETLHLVATLARALHVAHAAGIVHRDLKPGNVLMDEGGVPRITDFGLARWEQQEKAESFASGVATVSGQVVGTPVYMSPEQAGGNSDSAGPTSDIWSLGVVLYEILTGRRPFSGKNSRELMGEILRSQPPGLRSISRSVPREIEAICLKMLSKNPAHRFQTGIEVAEDLERFLAGKPTLTQPPSTTVRVARILRRNWKPITAGVLLVAAILMAIRFWEEWKAWQWKHARITLSTQPPGARIAFVPVDPDTGQPDRSRMVVPIQAEEYRLYLPTGPYLVEAEWPDKSVLRVHRLVTRNYDFELDSLDPLAGRKSVSMQRFEPDGRIVLPPLVRASPDSSSFASISGGNIMRGNEESPMFPLTETFVAPFEIQVDEVSRTSYDKVMTGAGEPLAAGNLPATGMTWEDAVEYAERIGCRLPTLDEYLFVATNGGVTRYPWGNEFPERVDWQVLANEPPEYDRTTGNPVVRGLYSRVAEWTESAPFPETRNHPLMALVTPQNDEVETRSRDWLNLEELRFVVGGGPSIQSNRPDDREFSFGVRGYGMKKISSPGEEGLGFRCVRDVRPQFLPIE